MKRFIYKLLIILAVVLALSGCSSKGNDSQNADSVEAASMRLVRIIGNVLLTDEKGANPPVQEDMRLFSGFAIDTEIESKAGVALDDVKAATIGEESRTELIQDGKHLKMNLLKGQMYFSVLKPLEADETFEIATDNMTMGIRGTSGYVAEVDDNTSLIILTSGHAMITAPGGEEQSIEAGQKVVVYNEAGTASFDVSQIEPADYPQLLIEELSADAEMLAQVDEQNDGDYRSYLTAMEQYREIIAHAAEYDYGLEDGETLSPPEPTGEYKYALVYVNETDTVPTLLLRQDTYAVIFERVRAFRYSPESSRVIDPGYSLASKMNDMTMSFTVYQADNGNGLVLYENYSGNGRFYDLHRLNFNGEEMEIVHEWEGSITEGPSEDLRYHELQWTDINNAGSLSKLTIPTDGDRTVLTGTIDTFSYADTVEMQQMPDWNYTDPNSTYRMIVLDEPQNLTCQSVDGSWAGSVRLILVEEADIPSEYDGRHITFSVDSSTIWWPSDTRMPVGQPGTGDIHILR